MSSFLVPNFGSSYDQIEYVISGKFSQVFRARYVPLNTLRALKVLNFATFDDDAKSAFERECQAAGRLSRHPNIVTVHGSDLTTDGQPFIDMEWYEQGSLGQRLRLHGLLPAAEVIGIGIQIARALEYAHQNGVLHRDLKPDNLLLDEFGTPLLSDFGIATSAAKAAAPTQSLQVFAPWHAAPELLTGGGDERSDIYALCSTLFELVEGQPPAQSLRSIGVARIPESQRRDVPKGLFEIISRGMQREMNDRYANASDIATALERLERAEKIAPVRALAVLAHPAAEPLPDEFVQKQASTLADMAEISDPPAFHVAAETSVGSVKASEHCEPYSIAEHPSTAGSVADVEQSVSLSDKLTLPTWLAVILSIALGGAIAIAVATAWPRQPGPALLETVSITESGATVLIVVTPVDRSMILMRWDNGAKKAFAVTTQGPGAATYGWSPGAPTQITVPKVDLRGSSCVVLVENGRQNQHFTKRQLCR